MNHTFYRYKLETADLYNPDTREVSVVFLGESGGRLRISLPADDARRLVNSWGPLLLKDMQRDSADPGAAPHSWGPLPLKVQQRDNFERGSTSYSPVIHPRTLAPGEMLTDASAASPAGTPGKADTVGDDFFSMWVGTYDGEARLDPHPVPFKDVFATPRDSTSAFAGPSTKAAHLNFTDDNGGKFTLAMEMQCFRKLRSAMLAVDENGNAIDPARPDDDSEIDAVVSALAALTDRVRALEERPAEQHTAGAGSGSFSEWERSWREWQASYSDYLKVATGEPTNSDLLAGITKVREALDRFGVSISQMAIELCALREPRT